MWTPSPVLKLELTEPLPDGPLPSGCRNVQALLTWNGVPCGWQSIPIVDDQLMRAGIVEHILDKHFESICSRLLRERLLEGSLPSVDCLPLTASVPSGGGRPPTVSVALCTRDRPADVERCLAALKALEPAPHEIVVVDNAPSNRSTEDVVARFPRIRYVREPRPGLSWARNRAVAECTGEIIAFVDDDVVVDTRWVGMMQRTLAMEPNAGAVTGLVLPYELQTQAQELFEIHGGFGRGYVPTWFHHPAHDGQMPWRLAATGTMGTGANMAFRRQIFEQTGLFTRSLGAGTRTEGGEDLEMLYRVIKCGFPIVYEPRAFVWHRHRYGMDELMRQMRSWGVGCLAYVAHARKLFPDESYSLRRFEYYWRYTLFRRSVAQYLRPAQSPYGLRLSELAGSIAADTRYAAAEKQVLEIEHQHGPQFVNGYPSRPRLMPGAASLRGDAVAHRTLELGAGVVSLRDVTEYRETEVALSLRGRVLGSLSMRNSGLEISRDRLINRLLEEKAAPEWLAHFENADVEVTTAALRAQIAAHMFPKGAQSPSALVERPLDKVSIVLVASSSQRLRRSLAGILAGVSGLDAEIVVVSNRHSIELPAAAKLRGVQFVVSEGAGRSAALNAGIRATTRKVVVCTNDRVVCDDLCLRRVLAPFARNDIDIVSGAVVFEPLDHGLPSAFRGSAARVRESEVGEVGKWHFSSTWLRPVPSQTFGTTSMLALRRELFTDPEVGPFAEVLGPGAASGGGEEGYFLYRALKAGAGILHEPGATVRQQRVDRAVLRRRFLAHGMGYTAFNLHTLLEDGDFRALTLMFWLPSLHLNRALAALRGSEEALPVDLMLAELVGHLAGPLGLLKSYRKSRGATVAGRMLALGKCGLERLFEWRP